MKKLIILSAICMGNIFSLFSANEKTTLAKIHKATVYMRGAELTCAGDFQAQPGLNHFIFKGVPSQVDKNSIQAQSRGNIIIMDVKYEMLLKEETVKPAPRALNKSLTLAKDSLVAINFDLDQLNEHLQNLAVEKNILTNNRLIKGETRRDTLDMFKDGLSFLHLRLKELNVEVNALKRQQHTKNQRKTSLEARINELQQLYSEPEEKPEQIEYCIKVLASSEISGPVNISVSFFSPLASWTPSYDLRANSNGTIDLVQKAQLTQQTGMNWEDIQLTLSTSNPSLQTSLPQLSPLYFGFNNRPHKNIAAIESKESRSNREEMLDKKDETLLNTIGGVTLADFTDVTQGMMQTEYQVKLKYAIPSDGDMHLVIVQNKNMKATYKYATVPKLDHSAYLLAHMNDWTDMNLIPGPSRLYFDGNYLGTSSLDPEAEDDTLKLSLGRDRNILIERKKLKNKTREKVLLDEKTIMMTYEIIVKNTHNTALDIEVTDQIPLSNNPSVVVTLINKDGAAYDEEKGSLQWNIKMKARETRKLHFTYEVKLPKNTPVAGL